MRQDRLRYELRLLGGRAFILPLAVVAIYLGFSLTVRASTLRSGSPPAWADYQMDRGLLALLENGLPLIAGLLAAAIVSPAPALDLHLSLPATYRSVILGRLALVGAWSLALAAAVSAAVGATGNWIVPVDQPLAQLTWAAPVLWYVGAGALLTLLLRSRIASSTILGMSWIAQFAFKPTFMQSQTLIRLYPFLTEEWIPGITRANAALWFAVWWQNRLLLAMMALAMLAAVPILLGRNEALLGHEA